MRPERVVVKATAGDFFVSKLGADKLVVKLVAWNSATRRWGGRMLNASMQVVDLTLFNLF